METNDDSKLIRKLRFLFVKSDPKDTCILSAVDFPVVLPPIICIIGLSSSIPHTNLINGRIVAATENEITVSRKAIIKGKGSCANGNTNAVLCITDGSIYTSCTDAANANDVTIGHMSTVCRGKGRSAKGKQYCYIKDIDMHLDEISDAISKKNAYQILLAKENKRKQLRNMIADYKGDISRLESELNFIRSKMESARAELENL